MRSAAWCCDGRAHAHEMTTINWRAAMLGVSEEEFELAEREAVEMIARLVLRRRWHEPPNGSAIAFSWGHLAVDEYPYRAVLCADDGLWRTNGPVTSGPFSWTQLRHWLGRKAFHSDIEVTDGPEAGRVIRLLPASL